MIKLLYLWRHMASHILGMNWKLFLCMLLYLMTLARSILIWYCKCTVAGSGILDNLYSFSDSLLPEFLFLCLRVKDHAASSTSNFLHVIVMLTQNVYIFVVDLYTFIFFYNINMLYIFERIRFYNTMKILLWIKYDWLTTFRLVGHSYNEDYLQPRRTMKIKIVLSAIVYR